MRSIPFAVCRRRCRRLAGRICSGTAAGRAAQRSAAAVPHDARLGGAAAGREVGGGHRRRAGAGRHDLRRRIAASTNSCAGRSEAPILKYNADGKLLASWGQGMFVFPHGATVDRDGNLWVTDARGDERQGPSGLQVQPGRQGADDARQGRRVAAPGPTSSISRPTSSSRRTATSSSPTATATAQNNRVVKFTKDGKFVKEWGRRAPAAAS